MNSIRRLNYLSLFLSLMATINIFADGAPEFYSAAYLGAIICGCTADIIKAITAPVDDAGGRE